MKLTNSLISKVPCIKSVALHPDNYWYFELAPGTDFDTLHQQMSKFLAGELVSNRVCDYTVDQKKIWIRFAPGAYDDGLNMFLAFINVDRIITAASFVKFAQEA